MELMKNDCDYLKKNRTLIRTQVLGLLKAEKKEKAVRRYKYSLELEDRLFNLGCCGEKAKGGCNCG